MSTAIAPPEVAALTNTLQALAKTSDLDRYRLVVKAIQERGIRNGIEAQNADELLAEIAGHIDACQSIADPPIAAAHAAHKGLVAIMKKYAYRDDKSKRWSGYWGELRQALTDLILRYREDERRRAAQQQAELDRAAEALRQQKAEEARKLLRDGNVGAAQAAMQEATAPTPVIAGGAVKLDNSRSRWPWQVEITDKMALVRAIADGIVPPEAVDVNESFIKREATSRNGLNWPGVRAWQQEALSVGRK